MRSVSDAHAFHDRRFEIALAWRIDAKNLALIYNAALVIFAYPEHLPRTTSAGMTHVDSRHDSQQNNQDAAALKVQDPSLFAAAGPRQSQGRRKSTLLVRDSHRARTAFRLNWFRHCSQSYRLHWRNLAGLFPLSSSECSPARTTETRGQVKYVGK